MTRIVDRASRLALVALACAACKSDPPPPADWVRPWSAWDHEKWTRACGEEEKSESGLWISWSTFVVAPNVDGEKRARHCSANVAREPREFVRSFSISVQARPGEIGDGLKAPLAALLDELPPDVGQALVRLVEEKPAVGDTRTYVSRSSTVRGFSLSVTRGKESDIGLGVHEIVVTVGHPRRFEY